MRILKMVGHDPKSIGNHWSKGYLPSVPMKGEGVLSGAATGDPGAAWGRELAEDDGVRERTPRRGIRLGGVGGKLTSSPSIKARKTQIPFIRVSVLTF